MYEVKVYITLKESVLDPQGQAVLHALHEMNYNKVKNVRMGKYIQLWIDPDNNEDIEKMVKEICDKLLVNDVIEVYTFEINKIN
ncbi:MAG: phosphoribosylformylglycinamidine synthase subunit PurS [Leptospiraceae bacterium]|nr:MAG: phosphoribosylformylglycinamidine synthase subunit PurS [Leptospiraceae bacterium]